MEGWSQENAEKLLYELDRKNSLFPGFELCVEENRLVEIGRGGFASVYKAVNKQRPKLCYAVKVIGFGRHVIASDRFKETTRLQRLLEDVTPYVCRLLDAKELNVVTDAAGNAVSVCEANEGRRETEGVRLQFILMEKLDPLLVRDKRKNVSLLREEAGTETEVLKLAMQIGAVLQSAHQRRILHRDIKLENIFYDSEQNCYKLGDFGIAKCIESESAETVVYTDGYVAPEIERRLVASYNETAEIYSFGIVLYLLLNGLCFPGSENYRVNLAQYDPKFAVPAPRNASAAMSRVIRKMCAYYPEERYQTMEEVLAELLSVSEKEVEANDDFVSNLPDLRTETVRRPEGIPVPHKQEGNGKGREAEPKIPGRAKRILQEREMKNSYNAACTRYAVAVTILLLCAIGGIQTDRSVAENWRFWLFPMLVLAEAILLRIKEFHILFGIATVGFGIYSGVALGGSFPQVLLVLSVCSGLSVLAAAGALSAGIWILLVLTDRIKLFDFLIAHDLGWIFLALVLCSLVILTELRLFYQREGIFYTFLGEWLTLLPGIGLIGSGLVLLFLQRFSEVRIPETIQHMHLIRTGIVYYILVFGYYMLTGVAEGFAEAVDKEEEK